MALIAAVYSCVAQETQSGATDYQRRLQALDAKEQALAKKRYLAAGSGAKLTAEENAEWLSVTGELSDIDPYWRFHRQLVEEIAAVTNSPSKGEQLLTSVQSRDLEFLRIVYGMRPAPTQEQAQLEVFQLRRALIIGDLKSALRLAERSRSRPF